MEITEFSHLHKFESQIQYENYLKTIFKDEKQFFHELFVMDLKRVEILPLDYTKRNTLNLGNSELFLTNQILSQLDASYDNIALIKRVFGYNLITYFKILFGCQVEPELVSDLILDLSQKFQFRLLCRERFVMMVRQNIPFVDFPYYLSFCSSPTLPIEVVDFGIPKPPLSESSQLEDDDIDQEFPSDSSDGEDLAPTVFEQIHYNYSDPECDYHYQTNGESKDRDLRHKSISIKLKIGMCKFLEFVEAYDENLLPKIVLIPRRRNFKNFVKSWELREFFRKQSGDSNVSYNNIVQSTGELVNYIDRNRQPNVLLTTSLCAAKYAIESVVIESRTDIKDAGRLRAKRLYIDSYDALLRMLATI